MALAATAEAVSGDGLPPGPDIPPLLQTLLWVYRPVWFMNWLVRKFPGGIFRAQLSAAPPFVVLYDPKLIEEVFALGPDVAKAGKSNGILRPLLGDESVLLLDGPRHARERRLLMPPFHGERMRSYASAIRDLAEQSFAGLPAKGSFALHKEFQKLTLRIILRVVLGLSDTPETRPLRDALTHTMDNVLRPRAMILLTSDGKVRAPGFQKLLGRFSPTAQFEREKQRTDVLLYEELGRRRAELQASEPDAPPREDILSLLLSARDEDGSPMTDQQLRDETMTLLVAGHETTATALSWTVAELTQHPEVWARARAEVQEVVGDGPLEAAHLPRLKYIDAIVTESLRLRPVLPMVGRLLEKPITLGGYHLPAGFAVLPSIYLTQRQPDRYPDPDAFRPERFLDVTPDPAAYLPFGGGVRRCIGRAFALLEMKVVLAQFVRQVKLELAPGYKPRVVRRAITFAPSQGLPVVRVD